jgi:homoaconitate hydratase
LGGVVVREGDGTERRYRSTRVGRSVQEIWVKGGLEGYIRASL